MEDDESNLAFNETSQPMDIDEPILVINPENKCVCNAPHCRELDLAGQLDAVLDLSLIFSSPKQPDKLWPLLAHGHGDPETYISKLNEYRKGRHCGLAWTPDYVAYRCRTCSEAFTMAICADCFRNGNHEGHDYNMFKSRSGGACDCGFSIMKSSGHCADHGENTRAPRSSEPVPGSLTCIPQRAMPRILGRLVMQLRRQAVAQTNETEIYLDTLIQIASSSTILRNIMIQTMLGEDSYSSHLSIMNNHPDARIAKASSESLKVLKQERKKLMAFKIPSRWPLPKRTLTAFCDKRRHKTFLEELIFWVVVYEFHQKLVCFLLSFLMDNEYKTIFAKLFVNYYPSIARCLAKLGSPQHRAHHTSEQLSRRILQVSVQIYNDSELTRKVCDEDLTLHTLIYCIRILIEGSQADDIPSLLQTNPLCLNRENGPKVISCDNSILRERQMASFTEDLLAILNFEHEAKRLLGDKDLLDVWLATLSYFQTMSPYKRELYEHAPYETGPRISVFMIESEFCLVPLWTILAHLKREPLVERTGQLLKSIHAVLANWLQSMSIGPHSKLDAYHMSFHIPLHRILAATIRHMIYEQGISEEQVFTLLSENQQILGFRYSYRSAHGSRVTIKIDDFLRMLLLHPLQALTLYHQTRSGMWTRNGLLTVNQAILYVHCSFCYSIVDMDMFLLRYCGSRLKPDVFLKSFLQRFYAWHCLSFTCGPIFSDMPSDTLRTHYYFNIQPEQITQLVESCLVTLIQLLTLENHCNISEREQTKRELITMISVADRSYSYLADMLPTITELNRDEKMFESLLEELTDYKPPSHGAGGNLQQGCYTLKSDVWEEEYDPIHVLYRYYQRRDYQQSLERFFQQAKLKGKLDRRYHASSLWPPLRVPAKIANFGPVDLSPLIECQTLLGLVYSIIYKCIHVEEMPDSMMAHVIYLLELAIRRYSEKKGEDHIENLDAMEHDFKGDPYTSSRSYEPTKNSNFAGRYCYRELISYYENVPRGEAMLKGRTIYSLFTDDQPGARNDPELLHENPKFFPFVKHALDLAFDTTWFPFESVLDNCLVHIETVHSLPRDEFDAMVQCASSERSDNVAAESAYEDSIYTTASASSERTPEQHLPDMSTSSSTRSTESQTGTWSNLIGIEMEEVDDDIIIDDEDEDQDEDDFGDLDIDDIDVIEQDDESIDTSDSDQNDVDAQPTGGRERAVDISDPDLTILGNRSTYETSTLDVASTDRLEPTIMRPAILSSPTAVEDNSANTEWASQGSSFRVGTRQANNQGGDLGGASTASNNNNSDSGNRSGSNREGDLVRWEDCMAAAVAHVRQQQQQQRMTDTLAHVGTLAQNQPTVGSDNNPTRMSQLSDQRNSADMGREDYMDPQQQATQAQNLITERRAILDSEPRPMITYMPRPLALEAASSVASRAPMLASATISDAAADQELSQERQGSAMSSSADRPLVSGSVSGQPSSFTRSDAILPRAYGEIADPSIQSSQTQQTRLLPEELHNQTEGKLSEVDIQARFMSFFQSDAVSRVNSSRIYRIRQTARRGNYRGAYLTEPYVAHPQTNNQANTTLATNNSFGGTGTAIASTTNNNTASTNNNNNNPGGDRTVEELVRRSVAVVPMITDAVRATARATISLAVGDEQDRRRLTVQRRESRREQLADSILNLPGGSERARGSPQRGTGMTHWRSGSTSTPLGASAGGSSGEQAATSMAHRRQVARRGGPYRMLTRFLTTRHSYQPPLQQQQQQQQQSYSPQTHHFPQDLRNSRRLRKEYRQHHGESILTLLLRLHAKYSQQPRSYRFDKGRARTNSSLRGKCRIGDGAHFVTIALDLICASDASRMLPRVELLTDLIWPKPAGEKIATGAAATPPPTMPGNEKGARVEVMGARGEKRFECGASESDDTEIDIKTASGAPIAAFAMQNEQPTGPSARGPNLTPSFGLNLSGNAGADLNSGAGPSQIGTARSLPISSLTPEEKRRRARERQSRLMAEFANKQRAFMEFARASASGVAGTAGGASASVAPRSGSVASTSPRAHSRTSSSACSSPLKYSNLTLQSDDKACALAGHAGSRSQQLNDEQPINLSSKSNQEGQGVQETSTQGALANSPSGAPDNNGARRRQHSSGQLNDDFNRVNPYQASSSGTRDTEFHDKKVESGNGGADHGQKQHQHHSAAKFSDNCDIDDDQTKIRPPQPQYECCICGADGFADLKNPLGQVVLLQSTSVIGHSHLRPRHDRQLPCEESHHSALKLETYAKYLERRIDLLCDHFTESSWLDSINIGAEGGVHVQSCGHYLHIECHQSYIRSLDQEDRLRARTDTDEFQCPVCRQLANSVLPILDDNFLSEAAHDPQQRPPYLAHGYPQSSKVDCHVPSEEETDQPPPTSPSSSALALSATSSASTGDGSLDDQIAQVALRLRHRQTPSQRELQSSAAFCSHLTKATGPQYRLVRTQASMHSLFLFLASIARTNLESGLIVQSIRRRSAACRQSTRDGPSKGSGVSDAQRSLQASGLSPHAHNQRHRQEQRDQPSSSSARARVPPPTETMVGSDAQKRTCFQLLFHVLALNAQTLINDQWFTYDQIWCHLTHSVDETNRLGLRLRGNEVPLLLRDPIAMLLQFLFTVSGTSGASAVQRRTNFTCLVKILFNLTVIQSVALVLSYVGTVPAEPSRPDQVAGDAFASNKSPSLRGGSQEEKAKEDEHWQDPARERNKQRHCEQDQCDQQHASSTCTSNQGDGQAVGNLLSEVWTSLGPLLAPNSEQPLMNSVVRSCWPRFAGHAGRDNPTDDGQQRQRRHESQKHDERSGVGDELQFIENKVKLACLPFLRAAAFLQEHLYARPSPVLNWDSDENCLATQASAVDRDFTRLVECLKLASGGSLATPTAHDKQAASASKDSGCEHNQAPYEPTISLGQTLNWPRSMDASGKNLIASWSSELLRFALEFSIAARSLLVCRPLGWNRPALMQLPHAFDDIFMFYYRRKCSLCQQVPKDVAVCLVCGAPICLRNSCCKDRSRSRQVHSQHCGANTAVFLAVHTSAIVVIRGSRACVWGSVYLDAHDEEDNGLQRGKPLYLVPARFALLETQWLTHSFDHTCGKRWIYLQDNQ